MEVSAKTLREVEFREKKVGGYHPEDVDNFLEQVAAGWEVLQDRLRQAVERAQRAEAAASEMGTSDETLRKTLVLAQRTADLAVQEAREQAARILAGAEQQAQAILGDAEDRGRRTHEDSIAEGRAELGRLEAARVQIQQDVETLQRWMDEHKAHLQAALSEALASVERAGVLWPAPSTRPLEPATRPGEPATRPGEPATRPGEPAPAHSGSQAPQGPMTGPGDFDEQSSGPDTAVWTPSPDDDLMAPGFPGEPSSSAAQGSPAVPTASAVPPAPATAGPYGQARIDADLAGRQGMAGPDDQALDDFFGDPAGPSDDHRLGGRLRRRR
ncbi:MAG: DivIVA domain-containing protein [Acidimicrobiales bacterium]